MSETSNVHGYGLDTIVDAVRQHGGFTNKLPISTVRRYIDTSDPVHGPGDDGAIVEVDGLHIVACGEALAPPFVAADPYGAGIAAVLANVNDVAAMGGVPLGLVNTVVGPKAMLEEVMRGMRHAADMYDVPIIGGHLTERPGDTSVSAFAVGHAIGVLSMANVRPGQVVVFACFLDGVMRADFPFFTSIPQQTHRFAADVRVMAAVAASGAAVAAKDVSMAGALGSLAMLLEFRKFGADIDLTLLPLPADTDFLRWMICFPSYAFWLTCEPDRVDECLAQFHAADLTCVAVGHITESSSVMLRAGTQHHELINLDREAVTGLWA